MQIRPALRFLLAAFVLIAASCDPATSDKPLSDVKSAKIDGRILGAWRGTLDKRAVYLHVSAHKDGNQMDLVLVGETDGQGNAVMHYQGHATVVGANTYLSLRAKSFPNPLTDDYVLAPQYIFVKVDVAKDGGVSLAWMDDKPVSEAIAAGKLKGTKSTIADDADNIIAFIAASDPKILWSPLATTFRKMR